MVVVADAVLFAGFGSGSLPLTEAVLVMVPAVAGAVALMVTASFAALLPPYLIQQALDVARRSSQRGREAHALRFLGDVRALRSEANQAVESYERGLTLGGELGMRPLVAHCHLGLGRLYRRTGKRLEAEEHLDTATTMYREMDMRFWLEKAEKEMAESASAPRSD